MTPLAKVFWTLTGALAVLVLGAALLVASPVVRNGLDGSFTTVRVHEKNEGFRLFIPVPSVLLDLGLRTALSHASIDEALAEIPAEARPWLGVAREAFTAIEEAPDVVLVAVDTDTESVRVEKRGRRLLVRVRSADADVDVAVPTWLIAHALEALPASPEPPRIEIDDIDYLRL